MNSPKQNSPPKYSGILWQQVTTLPVTKCPPVPFFPLSPNFRFVDPSQISLARTEKENRRRNIPYVKAATNPVKFLTSHHKKRGSLHSSSSANHSADSRGAEKKVRRRETRANNLHQTSLSSLLESGTTGSSLCTHRLLGTRISHRKKQNGSVFLSSSTKSPHVHAKKSPQIPTKFTVRGGPPQSPS